MGIAKTAVLLQFWVANLLKTMTFPSGRIAKKIGFTTALGGPPLRNLELGTLPPEFPSPDRISNLEKLGFVLFFAMDCNMSKQHDLKLNVSNSICKSCCLNMFPKNSPKPERVNNYEANMKCPWQKFWGRTGCSPKIFSPSRIFLEQVPKKRHILLEFWLEEP